MKIINLKDYYPYYTQDMFIEVFDELAVAFEDFHKAHYSLDRNDGIERDILFVSLTPDDTFSRPPIELRGRSCDMRGFWDNLTVFVGLRCATQNIPCCLGVLQIQCFTLRLQRYKKKYNYQKYF